MTVLDCSYASSSNNVVRGEPEPPFDFEMSGVFTWGEILSSLCRGGWCRTQLPRDFFEMTVPLNVYEHNFDDAFKALSMQALADGYVLRKKGKEVPYTVVAELEKERMLSFVSCSDTSVKSVPANDYRKHLYADSLKCAARHAYRDSVRLYNSTVHYPSKRYRVSFYVVSSSFLTQLGVDWTSVFLKGSLTSAPSFIAEWALKAVSVDDTTAEFRSVEVDLDSSTTLHWGSQRKEEKSIVTYSNGVSQQDYEWRDYGLTLNLIRDTVAGVRANYTLAQRDENNSVLTGEFGGGGLDSVSAWGVYDSYQYNKSYVPFLSSIPILGRLFEYENKDKVKSFFVIEVYPVEYKSNSFKIQDSIKVREMKKYEGLQYSTDSQSSFVDSTQVENLTFD